MYIYVALVAFITIALALKIKNGSLSVSEAAVLESLLIGGLALVLFSFGARNLAAGLVGLALFVAFIVQFVRILFARSKSGDDDALDRG